MLLIIIVLFASPIYADLGLYENLPDKQIEKEKFKKLSVKIESGKAGVDDYRGRALIYAHQKEYKKSLNDINKAIEIQSDDSLLYYMRSSIYRELGQKDKSYLDLNYCLKLDSSNVVALNQRGWFRYKDGNTKGAIEDYSKAIPMILDEFALVDEKDIPNEYNSKNYYTTKIKKYIEQYKKIKPDLAYLEMYKLGLWYLHMKEYEKVNEVLDDMESINQKSELLIDLKMRMGKQK